MAQGVWMYRQLKLAFAAGVLFSLGATGVASSADMPLKARPVLVPNLYNWTGCYLGANVGGAWDKIDTTQVGDDVAGPVFVDYGREKDSSVIGGGQAGCDFMAGKDLVFGVQSTFDFGSVSGTHTIPGTTFTETNKLESIVTATGRIGYLWTPQFLGYGKFGVAFLQDRNQVFLPSGAPFLQSTTFWQPALTAGIGGEWMFAPNWSVFAEWNYIWTEDDFAQHFNAAPPNVAGETLVYRPRVQTVLVGVNYKFHWDGPVVAKY
jgi:outer membrane immunogenic protein